MKTESQIICYFAHARISRLSFDCVLICDFIHKPNVLYDGMNMTSTVVFRHLPTCRNLYAQCICKTPFPSIVPYTLFRPLLCILLKPVLPAHQPMTFCLSPTIYAIRLIIMLFTYDLAASSNQTSDWPFHSAFDCSPANLIYLCSSCVP